MRKLMRTMTIAAAMLSLSVAANGQNEDDNPKAGLHSVATTNLGATAKGSGAPWNKNWPAINALLPGHGRPFGALFGAPMTGALLEIRTVVPVDIKGIELFPLKYRGTRQISEAEIYVEGKLIKTVELPHAPGEGHFFPLDARGQNIGVKVTGEHPLEDLGDGKKGAPWGGWNRIRIYSSTDVAAMMAQPEAYAMPVNANNIAPTSGAIATGNVEVYGQPRVATEHPKTIWDQVDIDHYKQMLKTSPRLRKELEALKRAMDERLTKPLGIPQPRKNDKGEWVHISDREVGTAHTNLALDIANLGTVYVLTGEAKYADFAKQLLLAYADAYPNYGVGARPGFNHDPSKVFDQRLGDAIWLIQVARGYDLIYNSPMTDDERRHIEDDLIKASGQFIAANRAMVQAPTNWSAIGTTAVLIAGVATDDEDLIKTAMFGRNKGKSENEWWNGNPNPKPQGVELHFSERSIGADGLWTEGAMGYQFMALQALIADAEILWHRGIDLYRYRDAALKRLFDSPLEYSYPDLRTPAINDSGHGSIVGREAYLYEFGYKRYRDPKYLLILKQTGMHLGAAFQQFPVSILYDQDLDAETEPVEWSSVNFFDVGYGILRNTTPRGTVSLLMDYGQSGSHDHPDKLNIDVWGFGNRLMPDPGSVWYEQPLYRNWYSTSVAHNTLIVDELNQRRGGVVDPDQLIYGPAETMGIQRARLDTAYAGVTMDRAVFVTPQYTADLFGAFARVPRKMDLAWHPIGELQSIDVDLSDFAFNEPMERGYNELAETRAGQTSGSYTAQIDNKTTPLRLVAAGGHDTQVIVGKGHLGMSRPPAILQRRMADKTIYGNALDYSGAGAVKHVAQAGSLADGYGLLEITTDDGVDLAFASYRPDVYAAGDLETDAQQAFVQRKADKVVAAYLGGGTMLNVDDVQLQRSAPGLAYIEQAETGAFIVGNPSPEKAAFTLTHLAIKGMKAYRLDQAGKRVGDLSTDEAAHALTFSMEAASRVEFAPAGVVSVYEHRAEMLRKRLAEQEAEIAAMENAIKERAAKRQADAKNYNVPSDTLAITQAEDMSDQGGGKVNLTDRKRNIIGQAFSGWNNVGHYLEYTFDVPAEGYYNLALIYCSEMENGQRNLEVNGKIVDPDILLTFPATGGWANSSDDWRLFVVQNEVVERPLLIKLNKGKNVIRMTNTNGKGVNLDYLAIVSPDVKVTREMLIKKQQ